MRPGSQTESQRKAVRKTALGAPCAGSGTFHPVAAEYTITTPEKVDVHFSLASIGSRGVALLIDTMVELMAFYALGMVIGMLLPMAFAPAIAFWILSILLLFFGYPILTEALLGGRTLGKMAMGLRVRMVDGSPITPGAAIVRNLLRAADVFPNLYFTGIVAVFFTERQQRLGDLVAGTVVIRDRRDVQIVPLSSPLSEGMHPLEPLIGELKGMTREEYDAIKAFCDRFPEMPAGAQARLIREVWTPIANRLQIPPFADVHPAWLMEAVVMKYARTHGLL